MPHIIQRKPNELSSKEKSHLILLLRRYYPTSNQKFIDERISDPCKSDMVLLKRKDIVLRANYYSVDKLKMLFFNKNTVVVEFGKTLKTAA
ncbi:MAG: hypothetical protein ABJP76_07700, partial [Flavobacteriaceae bacterium]